VATCDSYWRQLIALASEGAGRPRCVDCLDRGSVANEAMGAGDVACRIADGRAVSHSCLVQLKLAGYVSFVLGCAGSIWTVLADVIHLNSAVSALAVTGRRRS